MATALIRDAQATSPQSAGITTVSARAVDPRSIAQVWATMLRNLETSGPVLRRNAAVGISGLSRGEINEHFAVLYGAGLVHMQGSGRYVTSDGWRELIRDSAVPHDVSTEAWSQLRALTAVRRAEAVR